MRKRLILFSRYGKIRRVERYLCLDIGDKRIGVAVSDPFNEYALPVETYHRKNLKTDLAAVARYVKDRGVTAVVCGLPVNFDGTRSVQTEKAEYFIARLKETVNVKIITTDERCTTVEAEETLISLGKTREERKQVIDGLAAAAILDGYLGELKKTEKRQTLKRRNKMDKEEKTCTHTHEEDCDCGCCEEHTHGEHCDCCGEETVTLTMDNGEKHEFFNDGTIEYKGKYYAAFEPAEEIEGLEEGDMVIFEISGDDEDTAELIPVEDDALLDEVFAEFCKCFDEEAAAEEAEDAEDEE